MDIRHVAAVAAAALLVAASGCGLFRDAEISYMAPGGNLHTGHLECWMEITFTGEAPGDPRDVEVVFSSIVMAAPQKFDWAFISQHDLVRKGDWAGYKVNADTSPDADPPREMAIRVKFPIEAMDRLLVQPGDDLDLHATLYWGGEKQHSLSRGLQHVYAKEGSAL
jgi:hypothetical protein